MCSGSEAGSNLRLIDFVYHSTLGLRVIQKKRKEHRTPLGAERALNLEYPLSAVERMWHT